MTIIQEMVEKTAREVLFFRIDQISPLPSVGRDDTGSWLSGSLERRDGSAGQQLRAPAKPSRCSANDACIKKNVKSNDILKRMTVEMERYLG